MKKSVRCHVLTCSAVAALGTGMAHAQSTPANGTSATDDSNAGGVLQEVLVTAQKRSERLQDVPVAVTAANADQLKQVGVDSVLDLRVAAPSLNSTNASGYVANSIRGVGSLGFAPGIESPVGLYVDGVYLAAPQASELALNNIKSVEVLKGPQGTLFGRNATGGLIQITTLTPTAQPGGNVAVSYGNLNTWTGSAYISGGIAAGLAADLAFSGRTRDGIGTNRFDGADVGAISRDLSFRSKWVWTPGSNTTVTGIGSYWNGRDSNGWWVVYPGKMSGFVPGFVGPDMGYDADSNDRTEQQGWSALGALKIEQDFDNARFQSITAYRKGVLDLVRDLDYTPQPVGSLLLQQVDRQVSQELQLGSVGAARFKWTTGLYYFYLGSQYSPLVVNLAGYPAAGVIVTSDEKQSGESYAGYGQATYEIFAETNLTLGGRYTTERRAAYDASEVVGIPAIGASIPSTVPDRSQTASRFTYRISLDHRFSSQLMGYVSYNTGFKSGGYNTGAPGAPGYSPEKLDAYELGLKADLLDRRFRLNVAGFYYHYNDIQVQRVALASLIVFNGAKARIYGFDADFSAALSDHFSLTGGVNGISTRFQDFPLCPISTPGGGVPLVEGSCTGNQIPFAAKLTGSVAANYSVDIGRGKLVASGNVYYNSGFFFETDNVVNQPSYAKVGASLKWTSDNGYYVSLFGKNLTDRRTLLLGVTQTSGNVAATWADPRTYGVTVGYAF